jgi:flavin reductase ActVB
VILWHDYHLTVQARRRRLDPVGRIQEVGGHRDARNEQKVEADPEASAVVAAPPSVSLSEAGAMTGGEPDVVSGSIHPELFREAMTRFASGVTIVTTADTDGRWSGFTASAFSSLSLDPPLVLVCLAQDADSHPVFVAAPAYIVNVLGQHHEPLALHFARKGVDKFAGGEFRHGRADGLPVLEDALVSLKCRAHATYEGGDHTILIGQVEYAVVRRGGAPALHYDRRFWDVVARDIEPPAGARR